jgi:hypothetical protein
MSVAPRRDPKEAEARAAGASGDPAARCVLSLLTHDPGAAEAVILKLRDAGVPPEEISVIARGLDIEKRLIRDSEMNANTLASAEEKPDLPLLARRFASEPKLLLEGCWAIGPLFRPKSTRTLGAQGVESLAKAFLNAGLGIKEAADLESALKTEGGLWLALRGEARELEKFAREIQSLPGISSRLLRIVC